MLEIGNWTIIQWYGFYNPNTCLVTYYHNSDDNKAIFLKILPLRFLENIGYWNEEFGYNNKRIWIGLGFVGFFMDY